MSSAEAGAAKPDPRIFERALALLGDSDGDGAGDWDGGAERAIHAGDSVEHDVAGAHAAGLRAVLVVRAGAPPALPAGVAVIGSLAELEALAA
jgi:FMN phosphatase YigB (HAD superfamily)